VGWNAIVIFNAKQLVWEGYIQATYLFQVLCSLDAMNTDRFTQKCKECNRH